MAHFMMFIKCQNVCLRVYVWQRLRLEKVLRGMARTDNENGEQQPVSIMAAKAGRISQ